jgi:hypothetical protein
MADLASVAKLILTAEDKTGAAFSAVQGGLDGIQGKALGLVTGGLAALGAALTYGAFKSFIDGAIESAAAIQSLHEKTGVGIDALTSLRSAAKLADTDLQSIVPSILKLEQSMVKAAGGNAELAAAFTSLGVDVRESTGALREPDAVLLDLAKKFEDLEDGAAKTGLAMQIFGKQGAAMIPVLHELALQGEYVTKITRQQAEAADDYQKNLVKMDAAANSAKSAIGNALIPAMDAISKVMLETVTQGGGLRDLLMGLVADGSIASWAQTGVIWIARVADVIGNVLGLLKGLVLILVDVVKAFGQLDVVTQGMEKIVKGDLAGGMAQIKQGWQGIKDIGSDIATTWEKASTRTTKFEDAAISAVLRVSEMGNGAEKTGHQVTNFGAAHKQAADDVQKLVDKLEQERQSLAYQVDAMERYGVAAKASKEQQVELAIQQGAYNTKLKDGSTIFDEHAQKLAANATAEAKQIDILTAVKAIHEEYFKTVEKYNEGLSKSVLEIYKSIDAENLKKASLEGGAAAAVNYRIAEEQRYQQTAELSQAEIAASNARVTALEKLRGALADTGALQDAIKYQQQHTAELGKSVDAIDREVEVVARSTDTFGLSKLALIDYRIAQEQLKLGVMELSAEETKAIELRIAGLEKLKGEVQMHDALEQSFSEWKSFWTNIADAGSSFIVDFVEHGSSAFKNLWNDFKAWALEAIAKIAAQQIVVSIAGNFGAVSGAAANSLFGGPGLLSNLLGSSSNSSAAGPVQPTGILGSIGSLFGGGGGSLGAFGAGLTSPISTIASFATEGLAAAGGIAGVLGAAIPVLGVALAAGSLFGLFGKNSPAQREGTFGSNEGLGAGNPLFQSSSNLGTFGIFDDKWFSDKDQGQAIQQFLAGIAQVDNAIASIIDEPTLARVKANLATATTTFTAGMEHEASTFGDVIKDRYHNVVETIDPELTHLVDGFKGTSDQLGKFVIDVLSVAQVLRTFNSEDLFGQIVTVDDIVGLQRAGETVSQTFSRVASEFTITNGIADALGHDVRTAFGDVGLASEGLRANLIKLMGGAQQAGSDIDRYLNASLTDVEKQVKTTATATNTLNEVFGDLGVQVPQNWESLNAYIASLQLSDGTQQEAIATILHEAVPAFIALHGTAQDAANATNNQATANTHVATAAASVINPMMGVVQGFTQLRSAASLANDALSGISSQNDALEQFMGGSDNGTKLGNRLSIITGEIASFEDQLARYQGGDLSSTDNAFGEIATLMKTIAPLKQAQKDVADALGHFAVLSAQYGPEIANKLFDLEQNYNQATGTLAGNASALGILKTSFDSQWASIIGDAKDATAVLIDATQSVVEHVMTPLETAISGLHSAFGSDTALTDAVKWLNGVSSTSARSDDWQVNLNNALPDGKLVSQADVAAMTRVLGTLLDKISQNTEKTTTADTPQATGSRVTA